MVRIERYTENRIEDVLQFEYDLRNEEDFWGWKIDDDYIKHVTKSFENERFNPSISLLAYVDDKVVGRIDSSMIYSHFDGSVKAYLDWICVLKSYRHQGVARSLMEGLREELRQHQITTLVGIIAANEEAQRFYHSLENALIRDQGIWIDII